MPSVLAFRPDLKSLKIFPNQYRWKISTAGFSKIGGVTDGFGSA
jgi:hypothetical protein